MLAYRALVERQAATWRVHGSRAVTLFLVGDFYEAFTTDARIVADALDVPLSTIAVEDGPARKRIERAGVPYHSVDSYVGKLDRPVVLVDDLDPYAATRGR